MVGLGGLESAVEGKRSLRPFILILAIREHRGPKRLAAVLRGTVSRRLDERMRELALIV